MHNILHMVYDEKTSKDAIVADAREIADRNGDYAGQCSDIRFLDNVPIKEDREAAEAFIDANDKHWYDNLAVRFYDYPEPKKSKKYADIEAKVTSLRQKLRAVDGKPYAETLTKTEYVGCKACGSKVAVKYLKTSFCPVCGADMRPKTTLDKIEGLKTRVNEAEKELAAEEKAMYQKQKEKMKGKVPVKWLVKIEYHS